MKSRKIKLRDKELEALEYVIMREIHKELYGRPYKKKRPALLKTHLLRIWKKIKSPPNIHIYEYES